MNGRNYSLNWPIIVVTLLFFFGIITAAIYGNIVFDTINIITIVSVVLFFLIFLFSITNNDSLSFWLAFLILAFPNSFDNILPGVFLESPELRVIFPVTNHVEIYLILVLIYRHSTIKDYNTYLFPFALIILFLISILTNIIINYDDVVLISILCTGLYPVRILILICLLINNIKVNELSFVKGLGLSIVFLFIESSVTTIISGSTELKSASLGCNTFGNVIGQITCVFIAGIFSFKILTKKYSIYVLLGLLITVLTGTRMALLALICVLTFIVYPKLTKKLKLYTLTIGIVALFSIAYIGAENILGQKFDIANTMQYINISNGHFDVEMSQNTSSILTRLSLWDIAIRMFLDNPFTGIGWNLFNIYKYDYGFIYKVIIDPHNGYLALLSQLGLTSILYIVFYYLLPWIIYRKIKLLKIKVLLIFNMGMSICEITNAGIYKFNVFSLLTFIAVFSYYKYIQVYTHNSNDKITR